MKIKSFKKCIQGLEFVPEFGGNKEEPRDQQMSVNIVPMDNLSATKYRSLTEFSHNEKTGALKSNAGDVSRMIFIKHVASIKNLTLVDVASGKEVPCTCPAVLWDEGPEKLIEEIMKAIADASWLDEEKKLD